LFSHDIRASLDFLVELINTEPGPSHGELLGDVATLSEFVQGFSVSGADDLTAMDLAAVQALRPTFRPLFECDSDEQAARLVNAIIGDAPVSPRLTNHDDHDWHMHYFAPGASLRDHLAVDCAIAVAGVVAAGERERFRVCEAPDCNGVLVDVSRNRSRRYCDSRTCGNRLHVAAYRERQRTAPPS
jgi:predicted RNA-binding Zn ribbon-like protein